MAAVELQTREAPAKESFAALLDESLGVVASLEGTVVKGRVISVENDAVLIDVGLKSEGRVPLKEFAAGGGCERGGFPVRIVEAGRIPAGLFQAGVVVFAAVNAAERNRARRGFP